MGFKDPKAENQKQKGDLEYQDLGDFIPGGQRAEGKKDEDPNVIARAWEAAKESLGLGAWSDKQESQGEKEK
jgi:hypothetical protein